MSVPVLSRLLSVRRTPTRVRGARAAEALHRGVLALGLSATVRGALREGPSEDRQWTRALVPAACCQGPTHPTLRANPFPEVTDPFCRLPLSTLFYQLEAVHLGDLLRLWVRPGAKTNLFPWIFKGRRGRTGHGVEIPCSAGPGTPSPGKPISGVPRPSRRKDNSSRGPRQRLQVQLRCRQRSASRFRNFSRIPFR